MIRKYVKIFIIVLLLIILLVVYKCISEKNSKENVMSYEITNKLSYVLNKKYDVLLYGRVEELEKLYSNKYSNKIKEFVSTSNYEKILNQFYDIYIDSIQKKMGNIYIIKYTVVFLDNTSENFIMKVNMNWNNTRAIIIYDDMFGVKQ